MKHLRLIIASILAIAIGSILWAVVGPIIVLIGIPALRISEVTPRIPEDGNSMWTNHEAYSFMSWSGRSIAKMSSTYWLGFAVSIIGFCILVAGSIGIILAVVREMRA